VLRKAVGGLWVVRVSGPSDGGGGGADAQQVEGAAVLREGAGVMAQLYGVGGGIAAACVDAKPARALVGRRGVVHRHRCGVSALGLATVRAGGVGSTARGQAPVSTERAWARVASRTKRATLPARIKMSPR
jgi:hypothetical protein